MNLLLLIYASLTAAASAPPQAEECLDIPDGYEVAAYLDCGAPDQPKKEEGARFETVQGVPSVIPNLSGAMGTALSDADKVALVATGVNPQEDCVIAVAWYSEDAVQSVYDGPEGGALECVLPPTPARSFYEDKPTWSSFLLPLDGAVTASGKIRIEVRKQSGSAASVSAVGLLRKKDAVPRKRLLIVTGDDYPGHRWRLTAPEFARILRQDPQIEVSVSETPAILGSPLLKHYDGVMIHFKNYSQRLPLGKEVWDGLRAYTEQGGGLIVAHFGCGALQEWDGYVQVAGRIWNPAARAHDPYGPFDVHIVDTVHPITRTMKDFSAQDELYTCLDGAPKIQVLCEAISKVDQKPYPMGFAYGPGKGRVFHCPLGHDVNALSAEGPRELYRRGARWILGLDK